ncbi:hypothetical protein MPSEU_000853900 [Mayamaea pseudoterrestris]|nr:hypothetical protein MPSEU_000853900 [Mayamaea pseudoterrestris]
MTKKRRSNNLQVGLSVSAKRAAAGDVEDCLAELEQLQNAGLAPAGAAVAVNAASLPAVKRSKLVHLEASPASSDNTKINANLLWDVTLTKPRLTKDAMERTQAWNNSLHLWITQGTYTPGLLPSFETEVARHFQVEKLSKYLLETCRGLKMPAFERWLLDAKLEEKQRAKDFAHAATDAILPNAQPNYKACQRLVEEMVESGLDQKVASKYMKELCRLATTAVTEVVSQSRRYAHKIPLHKGDKIELEKHDKIYSLLYASKRYKKPFCIRLAKTHYEKLHQMFLHTHNHHSQASNKLPSVLRGKALHAFHYIIMTVLLRYSSLSGGQLLLEMRGGGMQGAIHGQVFEVLRKSFSEGPMLECFASPLNAYLPSFGSAFPEIDWHFGSVGDFAQQTVSSGCCEANPPFTPGIMHAMAEQIEECLAEANRKHKTLTFAVIVPTVPDDVTKAACAKRFAATPFRRMTASASCRHHLVLAAREHGYIAGAQHLKTTRYKYSIFDTSLIMLQSDESLKVPLPDGFEERIREAFQSRHLSEVGKLKKQDISLTESMNDDESTGNASATDSPDDDSDNDGKG